MKPGLPDLNPSGLVFDIGEALYGPSWRGAVALALDVGERRVRRWAAGQNGIPPGVWGDLAGLLEARRAELSTLIDEARAAADYGN